MEMIDFRMMGRRRARGRLEGPVVKGKSAIGSQELRDEKVGLGDHIRNRKSEERVEIKRRSFQDVFISLCFLVSVVLQQVVFVHNHVQI